MHAADLAVLGGLESGLLAAQLAVLAGDGQALAGALADQAGLELGDDGEDLQEHPGKRVVPVVCRPAEREPDAAGRQVIEDVQRVGHGPGEPVQLGDGQGVALPDGGEGLVEAGPGTAGAGEPLVEVDPVRGNAEGGQGLPLRGEVLGQRRAPSVADVRHRPPPVRLRYLSVTHLPYTLTETSRGALTVFRQ